MATLPSITNDERLPAHPSASIPSSTAFPPAEALEIPIPQPVLQNGVTSEQTIDILPAADVPNAFPHYADGDVLVLSGVGPTWKLHSENLRKSKVFDKLLDLNKAIRISRKNREDGMTIKWTIEMVEFQENPADYRLRSFRSVVSSQRVGFLVTP